MVSGASSFTKPIVELVIFKMAKAMNRVSSPLDSSEYVMGDKDRLIGILLNGLHEPITVKGTRNGIA